MERKYDYTVEECYKVTVSEAMRNGELETNLWGDVVSVRIFSEIEGNKLEESVSLSHSLTNFNGRRLWFDCPGCENRIRDLYITQDCYSWRCRTCHGLTYSSRRYHRLWRYENLDKYNVIYSKAKTKLMNKYIRWPTRVKLIQKLHNIDQILIGNINKVMERVCG